MKVHEYDGPQAEEDTEIGVGSGTSFWVRVWDKDPHNNGSVTYELTDCDVAAALQWGAERKGDGTFQVGVYVAEAHSVEDGLREPYPSALWIYGQNPLDGGRPPGPGSWLQKPSLGTRLRWRLRGQ